MIGELHALSAGYFLWDTITSIQLQSLSFTAHGSFCFYIITNTLMLVRSRMFGHDVFFIQTIFDAFRTWISHL